MALHREDVVRAAIELLDEVGLDALTTRALTQRLGVQRGALYWHVRSKRELLTAVAGEIMGDAFAGPPGGGTGGEADDGADDWAGQAESFAHRTRRAMLAHRDGARLVAGYLPMDEATLQASERGLALMRAAGLPLATAAHFGNTLASYVTGFVLQEQAAGPQEQAAGPQEQAAGPQERAIPPDQATPPRERASLPAERDGAAGPADIDPDRYPNLREWQARRPAGDASFAAGLSLIIGGLRAELADPRPARD
jgi:TetR/AcrR family tetracycline transcriptional repressor